MNNFRIRLNEDGHYVVTCKKIPNIEVIHPNKLDAVLLFQTLLKEQDNEIRRGNKNNY